MTKDDMSDLMRYRPPYPLEIFNTVIINNQIVRLPTHMLCFCIRTFFVNKERIIIGAVIP